MATQGSIIRALDYNNLQFRVRRLLNDIYVPQPYDTTTPSAGFRTYGYGQNILSEPVIAGVTLIDNLQLSALTSDILRIATHANLQNDTAISNIPYLANEQIIDNDHFNAFDTALTFLESGTNRFELSPYESSLEFFSPDISQTRSSAWGYPGNPTIRHAFTINFGTPERARYFFNAGGEIRMTPRRVGGSSTSQNVAWSNLLDLVGTVVFNHTNTVGGGSGSSSIGFYDLTSTAQQVYTKTGAGAYVYQYADNDYTVTMSCNVADNSDGGASEIYVVCYFNDDHLGSRPLYDYVDGTLTNEVKIRRASGANVEVVAPTATTTVFLGSNTGYYA